MKSVTITLLDGEHTISSPTFATMQLMEENGIDLAAFDASSPRQLNAAFAAMLTAAEPFKDGRYAKVWSPLEAGALIERSTVPAIASAIRDLFTDSSPESDGEPERPTSGRPRAAKQ